MRYSRIFPLVLAVIPPFLAAGQNAGSLCVKAKPGRAGVFVDGKYLGPAANFRVARTYQVAAGEHELKLVDPRYEELTTKVGSVANFCSRSDTVRRPMPITPTDPFKGRQYPGEVILMAVRWYLRYPLSYLHVSELLCERGLFVH